jgi:hypothetical protein
MTAFDPRKVPEQFEGVWLVAMGGIFVQIFLEVDYLYGIIKGHSWSKDQTAQVHEKIIPSAVYRYTTEFNRCIKFNYSTRHTSTQITQAIHSLFRDEDKLG